MAKDGSIHRAPICDMMPGGYHHRPGNGLILGFKFSGHSKKFVLFIYIFLFSEVHGFNNGVMLRLIWVCSDLLCPIKGCQAYMS